MPKVGDSEIVRALPFRRAQPETHNLCARARACVGKREKEREREREREGEKGALTALACHPPKPAYHGGGSTRVSERMCVCERREGGD